VAAAYEGVDTAPANAVPATEIGWKDFFPDPELRDLIGRALLNNRDLRIATLNVEAARAQYRIQRSDLVPSIEAQGSAANQLTPATLSRTGNEELTRVYTAGVGMPAYELDFFGRVRSLRNAALEDFFAVTENRNAAQLSLVSEVANAWLTLIADRELLRLAEETRASQRQSYDLTKLRFDQGVSGEIELRRSESLWREAEVDIAQQTRRVAVDRNALALLVGEPLPPETGSSAQALESQTHGKELPAGLPADLLVRRPDVRAAEHALRPRTPTSAPRAPRFFPASSSPASTAMPATIFRRCSSRGIPAGISSRRSAFPFSPAAPTRPASISPTCARASRSRATSSRSRLRSARLPTRWCSAARSRTSSKAQEALTRASESSYKLADMRYRGGVDSYLGSLIAQRDMYDAQRALIVTRLAGAVNLVQLYQALGGGWKE
jgi:multidrug efflux system outer membrane protein